MAQCCLTGQTCNYVEAEELLLNKSINYLYSLPNEFRLLLVFFFLTLVAVQIYVNCQSVNCQQLTNSLPTAIQQVTDMLRKKKLW